MPSRTSHPESLRDLKRIILRHKWRFIIPTFGVTMAVLLVGLLLPRKYEGQAIFERRNDLVMTEVAGLGAPQSFTMLKRSLKEELSGLPAVDHLVEGMNLVQSLSDPEGGMLRVMERQDLVVGIHKRLGVHYDISTPEVDRIRVSYSDSDPDRAREVVNKLVENYIDRARRQVDQMLGQAASFFETQALSFRKKIEEMEDKKLRFEIQNTGLLPSDASNVQDALIEAESSLGEMERRQQATLRRIESLQRELAAIHENEPNSVIMSRNPELARIDEQLRLFRDQLDRSIIIEKMTDEHPTVQGLKRKITDLERRKIDLPQETIAQKIFGNSAKRAQLDLALINAQSEVDSIREQIITQRQRVETMKGRTTQFFPVRAEYRKFERAIEEDQRQLNFWEGNLRRVKVALTAELGQRGISMDFIKPCGPIQRPISPDLMQVLFAAISLGIAAGIGCVLFADRTDQTLRSLEQANGFLPVPVLGAVAEIITRQQAVWRRWSHRVITPMLLLGFVLLLMGAAYLNYLSLRKPYLLGKPDETLIEPGAGVENNSARRAGSIHSETESF